MQGFYCSESNQHQKSFVRATSAQHPRNTWAQNRAAWTLQGANFGQKGSQAPRLRTEVGLAEHFWEQISDKRALKYRACAQN